MFDFLCPTALVPFNLSFTMVPFKYPMSTTAEKAMSSLLSVMEFQKTNTKRIIVSSHKLQLIMAGYVFIYLANIID